MLLKLERFFDKIIDIVGNITAFIMIIMTLNVAFDVTMRYVFHNSSVGMQELEWHFFSILILFGMSYALKENGHVRVDFLYDGMREKKKAWINVIGTLIFLFPIALLVFFGSFEFVMDSYTTNEISEDPGGLKYRWMIKAMIPVAFGFLMFSAVGYIIKNINIIRGVKK